MPSEGGYIFNAYAEVRFGGLPDHIAALKRLLLQAGFDVPLYTATGWDNAIYPEGAALPVLGTYVDEPWETRAGRLPPKSSFAFQYGSRAEYGLGAVGGISEAATRSAIRTARPPLAPTTAPGCPPCIAANPMNGSTSSICRPHGGAEHCAGSRR